jgi:ribosomal RNA-processing protein 1
MKVDVEHDVPGDKAKKTKKRKKIVARWDDQRVDEMLEVLAHWPFVLEEEVRNDPDDDDDEDSQSQDGFPPQHVPVGLKLHVLDIWIDELEKAGLVDGEEDDQQAADIVQRIAELVETLQIRTTSKAVRIRSKQSLLDERLKPKTADQEDGD